MTPEEHAAEAERVYGRVYDKGVHAEAAAHFPGTNADSWEVTSTVQQQMMSDANYHATMALVGLLQQFPICDHGNRGWCQPCFKQAS